MRIKLIKGWNGNSPGSVLEPELNGVAQLLIDRGLAVEIKSERKGPRVKPSNEKENKHVQDQ